VLAIAESIFDQDANIPKRKQGEPETYKVLVDQKYRFQR